MFYILNLLFLWYYNLLKDITEKVSLVVLHGLAMMDSAKANPAKENLSCFELGVKPPEKAYSTDELNFG
jgi:hypothetical protein